MSCKFYVNDIGKNFDVDLNTNLISVTNISLRFTKPNGDELEVTPTILSEPDGTLRYVPVSGDFNVAGWWRYQVEYDKPLSHRSSNIGSFKVHESL